MEICKLKDLINITLNRLYVSNRRREKGKENYSDVCYAYSSTLAEIYLTFTSDTDGYMKINNLIRNGDYNSIIEEFERIIK